MKTTEVQCDSCGKDLTTSTNYEAYCLELANRSIPSAGGVITLMAAQPALRRDFHFCGVQCLRSWFDASFDECGSDVAGVTERSRAREG